MTAQLHLPCGGEVAKGHSAVGLFLHKGGLRVLKLCGDLLHEGIAQGRFGQRHTCLVTAEDLGGKGVHHIGFHLRYLPRFLTVQYSGTPPLWQGLNLTTSAPWAIMWGTSV